MSTTIDNRIVEMKFNNSNFEKNVQTSMNTIDKFKKALNLTSSAEKFNESLKSIGNNASLDSISNAVDSLQSRFSNLGIVGITILQRITNGAIDAAKRITSAVTGAVIEGGKSRAMNIEQAKFQLSGLDVEWSKISKDINHGVEDTAYGLDQAAIAASQLVASGVQFGETFGPTGSSPMAKALRGISGVAAMTNSEYSDISRIFTTVAGNGKVMANELNMIGSRGLNAAAEMAKFFNKVNEGSANASESTAAYIRELTGGMQVTEAEIREFASDSKLNFAVFSEAMDDAFGQHATAANKTFTGVLSNIRAAMSKIGADFWTPIIENEGALVQMLGSVKDLLNNGVRAAIHDALGWKEFEDGSAYLMKYKDTMDKLFNSIRDKITKIDLEKLAVNIKNIIDAIINIGKSVINIFSSAGKIIKVFISAFRGVFNIKEMSSITESFRMITGRIESLTSKLKPSNETLLKFHNIFKAVASVASLVWDVFKGLFGIIKNIFTSSKSAAGGILDIASGFGEILTKVTNVIKESGVIKSVFSAISSVVGTVVKIVSTFVQSVGKGFKFLNKDTKESVTVFNILSKVLKFVSDAFNKLAGFILPKVSSAGESIGKIFKKISEIFSKVFSKLGDFAKKIIPTIFSGFGSLVDILGKVVDIFLNGFNNINFDNLFKGINGGIFAAILLQLRSFISGGKNILSSISGVFDTLKESISNLIGGGNNTKAIKDYAIAIGILAGSLVVISSVDVDKLAPALGAISALIFEMSFIMKSLVAVNSSGGGFKKAITGIMDSFSMSKNMSSMLKFAGAIFILAGALKMLSGIDWKGLAVGLSGLAGIFGLIVAISITLDKTKTSMVKGSTGLILFAAAVAILAGTLKKLSELKWEELAKGFSGLAGIIGLIVGISVTLDKTKSKMIKGSVGLIAFGAAIAILTNQVIKLSGFSWTELAKGLIGLAGILGGIAGLSVTLSTTKADSSLRKIGISMIPFAAGVLILSESIKKMSGLSWMKLAKGLAGLAGALGIIAGLAVTLSKTSSSLTKTGIAMIPFAAGVLILSNALNKMSGMSWEGMAKSLIALGVVLGGLSGLSIALQKTGSSLIKTSAGIFIFAAAMAILTPVLKSLGNMSWESLAVAMAAIAGSFTVLGLAALILKPLVPTIAALGLSITLFGIGCLTAGAGVALFATGIASLGVSMGLAGGGIASFIKQIISVLPEIISAFGETIKGIALVIAEALPSIVKAFVALISAACQAIIEAAPMIFETIIQLLDSLITYIPQIADKVITMIISLFDTISGRMPELINSVAKLVKSFIDAVVGLFQNVSFAELVSGVKDLSMVTVFLAIAGKMGMAAIKGLGILAIIIAGLGALTVGLGFLVSKVPELEELLTKGIPVLEKIGYAIGSFVGNIIGGLMAGISSGLPAVATNLSMFMANLMPFIVGIKMVDESVANAALNLAATILILTGAELLNGIASFLLGESDFGALGEKLVPFGESMKQFAESTKGLDPDVVTNAANAGRAIAEMASAMPNSGGLLGKIVGENDLSMIGPQLEGFGEAISKFAEVTKGLDGEVVTNAANAGKAIAEMAKAMPNSGGVAGFFAGENDLGMIAPQLEKFGEAMKSFSESVSGMDPEVVTNAANAGKALAEMASSLPNEGGVLGFFAGENDLATFSMKLVAFGYGMKLFSLAIDGINPIAIIGASIAGRALAEMASTIPNTGGLISFFAGDNDLAAFGEKLPEFGKAIKEYSDNIQGIDALAIWASAIAGSALVELANTVPGTGGLLDFLVGNNDIDKFGEKLVPFGTALKDYSDEIKGIDALAIWGSAVAGLALTALGKSIDNTGGVLGFFAGDNDFETFGKQLNSFGTNLVSYSVTIKDLDHDSISASVTTINKIISMFNRMQNIDSSTGSNFSKSLADLGTNGINSFVTAVDGSLQKATGATKKIRDAAVDGIKDLDKDMQTKAQNGVTAFITQFANSYGWLKATGDAISKAIIDGLNSLNNSMITAAQNSATAFITQFANTYGWFRATGEAIAKAVLDGVSSVSFYNAGADATQGYINGLNSKPNEVYTAGYNLGKSALTAAKEAVDSNSPSKEFEKLGKYNDEGLAIGMTKNAKLVDTAAEETARSSLFVIANVISEMSKMIDDNMDIEPVIRPVFDSSEIQNGISSLNKLSNNQSVNIGASGFDAAQKIGSASGYISSGYNDSNVVNAINGLEDRMDTLASRMENLKIVLDSGILVGELSPGINEEFGNMGILAKRGVI